MTANASCRYLLRWIDANGAVAERQLPQGWLTVGSAHACDLVLSYPEVSRQHARVHVDGDQVEIHDLRSLKGTFVNRERVASADLSAGDEISLGGLSLHLIRLGMDATQTSGEATLVLASEALSAPARQVQVVALDQFLRQTVVSEKELAAAGIEVKVSEYAAVGGGLGSFVWVDLLRNSGVSTNDIIVSGNNESPQGRYERLCLNSQIPAHERLRSSSDSCPDNVWGFPGYAVREAWREARMGNLKGAVAILWSIFGEPVIAQTYTPRSGDVFRSIDREAERIGWRKMLRVSHVLGIRKAEEGRLLVFVLESAEGVQKLLVVSARCLHLAIGYPAIRLLPELADYREKWWDKSRVVNAYEPHDHVYAHLRERGGTVLVRGRGIVASRIIQRLVETRQYNDSIVIVHLHRSQGSVGHRFGLSRRSIEAQFEFQPFNWPKGCWGGEQRRVLEKATGEERKRLLEAWEGTTTAKRSDWRRLIAEGSRQGWYRAEFGVVSEVRPTEGGRVNTRITSILAGGGILDLVTDFVIDCTGAVPSPARSPLMADLIQTYDLPLNKLGRLQVNDDFEVEGMRHGQAGLYAAGVTTLGGPYAAVDSFLGLQYAALRATDSMFKLRPKGLRRLNGIYSFWQWTKWARGIAP